MGVEVGVSVEVDVGVEVGVEVGFVCAGQLVMSCLSRFFFLSFFLSHLISIVFVSLMM